MAKTAEQIIRINKPGDLYAFPVASGETMYKGTFAGLTAGYLADLDSANLGSQDIIVLIADATANTSGPAATTANGSISGTNEIASADAGDKTVRKCYMHGEVLVTGAGFAQTSVGKTCYLTDNYTGNITGQGAPLGMITRYISSTKVYVNMNQFSNEQGMLIMRGAITAATTTAGGDAISWSPLCAVYLMDFILDVTTAATGAATMDIGIAANGTTSADTLIDGVDVGTAAIFTTAIEQLIAATGSAAGAAKMTATQYITGTPSATLAGLVGTWTAIYIKA
jgi:hypothetical protein